MRTNVGGTIAALLLVWSISGPASAQLCDDIAGTTSADIMVVGAIYTWNMTLGNWVRDSAARLGVCRWTGAATSVPTTTNCDWNDGVGADLAIRGDNGDDTLILQAHDGGIIPCGTSSTWAVGPYDSSLYDFKTHLFGNDGADRIFGSNGNDVLHSTNASWTTDGDQDFLCAFGGADYLYGDDVDGGSNSECFHGGSGTDVCYDPDSSPESDRRVSTSCETATNISSTPADSCTFFCPSAPVDRCDDLPASFCD
jgi:Ca2+-binding RTX toxin-like protein